MVYRTPLGKPPPSEAPWRHPRPLRVGRPGDRTATGAPRCDSGRCRGFSRHDSRDETRDPRPGPRQAIITALAAVERATLRPPAAEAFQGRGPSHALGSSAPRGPPHSELGTGTRAMNLRACTRPTVAVAATL